jgi:hypothetical protein
MLRAAPLRRMIWIAICLALSFSSRAEAGHRRALLIGINRYQADRTTERMTDLEGAVADAEAMSQVLQGFHGFDARDIHILRDREATRDAILRALDEHLIAPAGPGDLSVFYFAGHGSYRSNPASRELDGRDETLVPADTNRGAPDIHDKELAARFNQVLGRGAQLVALFDSCHSGSIARGLPGSSRTRFVPPAATPGPALPAVSSAPEERGALIFSAAQDQQPAQERRINGRPRGRFSSALEQVLSGPFREAPAREILLRVRALMQAGGSPQEPVLAATAARQQQALFGGAAVSRSEPGVAVSRISGVTVHLQGGLALGLGVRAELYKEKEGKEGKDGKDGKDRAPVRLRILEVTGISSSTAELIAGDLSEIRPGDLFYVDRYGIPQVEGLRIYIPPDGPSQPAPGELGEIWATAQKLTREVPIKWVADPTEETPTHVLSWQAGSWCLDPLPKETGTGRSGPASRRCFGARPGKKALLTALRSAPRPRVYLRIPIPREMQLGLISRLQGTRGFVQVAPDAASADYWLVGRITGGQAEAAWIMPDVQGADRGLLLPARSAFIPIAEPSRDELMLSEIRRLTRIKLWKQLDSPLGDSSFPYRLALRELAAGQLVPPGSPLRGGREYQLLLVADEAPRRVQARYVYVFNIDRDGNSTLLVPVGGHGNVENLVPDLRDQRDRGVAPQQIPIGHGFTVTPPYGTDTLVMLTSATALPNPEILSFSSGRRSGSAAPGADPLSLFLFGLNTATRSSLPIPTSWSVQRMVVESVEK